MPTCPASVKTSTISQPSTRKLALESFAGSASRSIGLVQKCGCGGAVLPRHSTTRVRTSVIFTPKLLYTVFQMYEDCQTPQGTEGTEMIHYFSVISVISVAIHSCEN